MSTKIDLTNQRFGRLVALEDAGHNSSNKTVWKCLCDCGNIHYATTSDLRRGDSTSCGCFHKEQLGNRRRKHGYSNTKLYKTWKNIRARCNNPNEPNYPRYGGRGIKVCDEWNDFINFKAWSESNNYNPSLSIDRINNDGNYEPSNCRWVDKTTQIRNRSITRKVEFNGEKITIKELSEKYNVNYFLLYDRIIKYKWSVNDSIQDLLNR